METTKKITLLTNKVISAFVFVTLIVQLAIKKYHKWLRWYTAREHDT